MLIGEQHTAILLYDLVDSENDQLERSHRRRHNRPRFMQLETGLFHSVCPPAHPSGKKRGNSERKHVHLRVVCREWGEVGDEGEESLEVV